MCLEGVFSIAVVPGQCHSFVPIEWGLDLKLALVINVVPSSGMLGLEGSINLFPWCPLGLDVASVGPGVVRVLHNKRHVLEVPEGALEGNGALDITAAQSLGTNGQFNFLVPSLCGQTASEFPWGDLVSLLVDLPLIVSNRSSDDQGVLHVFPAGHLYFQISLVLPARIHIVL